MGLSPGLSAKLGRLHPLYGERALPWVCRVTLHGLCTAQSGVGGRSQGSSLSQNFCSSSSYHTPKSKMPACPSLLFLLLCWQKYVLVLLFLCKTACPSLCLTSPILWSQFLGVIIIVPVTDRTLTVGEHVTSDLSGQCCKRQILFLAFTFLFTK